MSSMANVQPRPRIGNKRNHRGISPPNRNPRDITKTRVSHACDRCRLMRTRCSGGERCSKCIKDDAVCVYGDRKRERNQKDLAESLDRVQELEGENTKLINALRSVVASPDFRTDMHGDIMEILSKYTTPDPPESGQPSSSSQTVTGSSDKLRRGNETRDRSPEYESKTSGEKAVASSVGSPGRKGELARVVDLDAGSGAAGLVGKMSEMSWIQHAFESLHQRRTNAQPGMRGAEIDHHLTTAKDFSYFMDDTNVLAIDEDHVNQYHWPKLEIAIILAEAYFHAMQDAFQIVLREQFLQTMVTFSQKQQLTSSWSGRRWFALANLVWAIGAKWLQMTKLDQPNFSENHLLYYARARALGLDHRMMFDHPDIERVQGIGLLAFYLLMNGSIFRAWNILGHATRHAIALALHLRVSDPNVSDRDKEQRARTWYSLYSLEILIAEITGRPKSIFLSDVTTPIDLLQKPPTEEHDHQWRIEGLISPEESRNMWLDFLMAGRDLSQGMTRGVTPWKNFASVGHGISRSYFPHRVRLCRLSDKIASQLYSGTSEDSWADTQRKIGELQTELRLWAENLPDDLAIQSQAPTNTDPRVKIELSMYYHSIQMILHRPCLCEVVIEHESLRSQEFNRSSARACVHAAMSMLALMPDNPSAHEAYQLLPWWTLLHYVAQAAAVLLLELSLGGQHFQNEISDVVNFLRKAMAYLWCMTESSLSAYRAWRILRRLLTEVSQRYDMDMADIPTEASQPPGWSERHEMAVRNALS
ncbi:uncharacterized protein Z518_09974 [Rhinocladiella mackenziei CBS 650.93]|uniref:Zn(2)-C6 fungal-type domain-containing protein n=1 Tax=Rhinocladiella mackenziei CBS 650.93 TaxID=1442369 RepID=A0A0D2I525_9EURO|nr:uncharacterized protein Z518_09974 [Rhinocladiella mackenziei CBS 650.93]KIX00909.1 hypothetical protein Z518_09974 [Rhinocladiella mackenziei CBS 650.93]